MYSIITIFLLVGRYFVQQYCISRNVSYFIFVGLSLTTYYSFNLKSYVRVWYHFHREILANPIKAVS